MPAKSNPVLVTAVSALSDSQLEKLAFHLEQKTPILCSSREGVSEDGKAALHVLASTKTVKAPKDGMSPKSWLVTLGKLEKAVGADELAAALSGADEATVRQSVRTVLKRRAKAKPVTAE